MSEVLFRSHRGGFDESMATVVPVTTLNDVAKHLELQEVQLLACAFVTHDPRNNWETHAITYNGACIGHSNAMLGFAVPEKVDIASIGMVQLTKIFNSRGLDLIATPQMLFVDGNSEVLDQALKAEGIESRILAVHVIGDMFVVPIDGDGKNFVPALLKTEKQNHGKRKGRR